VKRKAYVIIVIVTSFFGLAGVHLLDKAICGDNSSNDIILGVSNSKVVGMFATEDHLIKVDRPLTVFIEIVSDDVNTDLYYESAKNAFVFWQQTLRDVGGNPNIYDIEFVDSAANANLLVVINVTSMSQDPSSYYFGPSSYFHGIWIAEENLIRVEVIESFSFAIEEIVAHEFGHSLGLVHYADDYANLMDPHRLSSMHILSDSQIQEVLDFSPDGWRFAGR